MTKTIMTKAEAEKLRRQCGNRLNWTDGGHWIGTGPEPSCFRRASVSSTMTVVLKFPTDAAAFKWNTEHEKRIRYSGYVVGAGITFALGLATSGWGWGAAGAIDTIADVFQGEVLARFPYPKVARGWSYTLVFTHTYNQPAAVSGRYATFLQLRTGTVRDQNGKTQWTCSGKSEYTTDSFPDSVARHLVSTPNLTKTVIYN